MGSWSRGDHQFDGVLVPRSPSVRWGPGPAVTISSMGFWSRGHHQFDGVLVPRSPSVRWGSGPAVTISSFGDASQCRGFRLPGLSRSSPLHSEKKPIVAATLTSY